MSSRRSSPIRNLRRCSITEESITLRRMRPEAASLVAEKHRMGHVPSRLHELAAAMRWTERVWGRRQWQHSSVGWWRRGDVRLTTAPPGSHQGTIAAACQLCGSTEARRWLAHSGAILHCSTCPGRCRRYSGSLLPPIYTPCKTPARVYRIIR
jgi:hypothetical protein